MTQATAVYPQNFGYYNFVVMNNFVFEEPKPVIYNSYTYIENGVYYCATPTQEGGCQYAYCMNSPIMYRDPNGEWVHLVIGAVIGGAMNLIANAGNINNFWQGLGYFAIGAVAGAVGAGVGAGFSSALAGGSFAAGFAGTSAAVTSTGFTSGFISGGMAMATSNMITGAGNAWMQGATFGQGLREGVISSAKGLLIGSITGGIMGGLDAAMDGRNFMTGDYKQYDLQRNYIASADGTMFEQYSIPDNATVVNMDSYNVYYKPEKGEAYGINNVVKPGKYITKPVDGVATSKYTDMVFKVPGKWGSQPPINVFDGGDVGLCMGSKWTDATLIYKNLTTPGYTYGWMTLPQLDNGWSKLFELARIIRFR